MLRHVGRTCPTAVVLSGMTCGILASCQEFCGLACNAVLLLLMCSRDRILHCIVGICMGLAAYGMAPGWADQAPGTYTLTGIVDSLQESHGSPRVVVRDITVDGKRRKGKALIGVYDCQSAFHEGARVTCSVVVKKSRRYGNEGEFDYQRYLTTQGVVMLGSIAPGSKVEIDDRNSSGGLKDKLILHLNRYARPEAELIKAMVLGDRSGITYSLRDILNSLGVSHLIAISGLHIGIFMGIGYGVIKCTLRSIPPLALRVDSPFISRLGCVAGAVAFTMFVGPEVTVVRACIMATCCVASLFFLRRSNLVEGLCVAGIAILFFWPLALYSASFQLSFCAVLGIASVLEKSQDAPAWFRWVLITFAAGAFTTPITVYLFGFISVFGFLANLVIVPLFVVLVMPLSIAGVLLHVFFPYLSEQILRLDMLALRVLLDACGLLGRVSPVPTPWIGWVYLSYVGLVLAFWGDMTKWRTPVLAVVSFFLFALPVMKHVTANEMRMKFDFISVGQGDSTLICQDGHAILVDAGPASDGFDAGRLIVAPHILRRGYSSLDAVVVTHVHPDHCGGVPFILNRFPVRQVWINASQAENPYFQEVMRITKEKSIPLKYVCRGDRLHAGKVTMEVLSPRERLDTGTVRLDQNLQSIVLMVSDGETKGLFMGDADMFGELILVHSQMDISADVLKVAHHGGERSCLDPFLDAVRPDIAVICCGSGNRYGDPSDEPLERLKRRGIRVYRTDIHGEIMITFDPEGASVKLFCASADNQ